MQQEQNARAHVPFVPLLVVPAVVAAVSLQGWWTTLFVERLQPLLQRGLQATVQSLDVYHELRSFVAAMRSDGTSRQSILVLTRPNAMQDYDRHVLYELYPSVPSLVNMGTPEAEAALAQLKGGDVVFATAAQDLGRNFMTVTTTPNFIYVRTPCTYCK